jgi:GR25 family glycosyltransferase involved in LPS biosynthesis
MFSINNHNLCDRGFYINLKSSTERDAFVKEQIEKYSIRDFHRFEARTDPLHCYSCTKSHRAVFEEALSHNLDSIFIAEDDFEIYDNPKYFSTFAITLNNFLRSYSNFILSNNYDVLMFGCNPKEPILPINAGFGINSCSTGAWAYIIKNKPMKYILDNYCYIKDYQAIDDILPLLNNYGFKTLVTIPMLIGHRNGILSTLQPHIGKTHYQTWIEGNWHKNLYEKIYNSSSINNIFDIYNYLNNNTQP